MYQEDPKTRKDPISLNNIAELFLKGPFQSKYTETSHIPIMDNHEPEHGEHSKNQEKNRDDIKRDPFTYEDKEEVEINSKHLEKFCNDKHFKKVMEILLNKEKEKYVLKLEQEGAKLTHHFNIETIITPKVETKTSKLQK